METLWLVYCNAFYMGLPLNKAWKLADAELHSTVTVRQLMEDTETPVVTD